MSYEVVLTRPRVVVFRKRLYGRVVVDLPSGVGLTPEGSALLNAVIEEYVTEKWNTDAAYSRHVKSYILSHGSFYSVVIRLEDEAAILERIVAIVTDPANRIEDPWLANKDPWSATERAR